MPVPPILSTAPLDTVKVPPEVALLVVWAPRPKVPAVTVRLPLTVTALPSVTVCPESLIVRLLSTLPVEVGSSFAVVTPEVAPV